MAQDLKDNNVKLYQIFEGEIASIQTYGVFVQIPDTRKQGLVHISQMSASKVDHPADICNKGDKVWCKVISADNQHWGKIGLSMKMVNQGTGQDTDPNNVQAALDEQKRKTGHKRDIPKIELEAVYHTTCRKCGGKDHDCKLYMEDELSLDLAGSSVDHPPCQLDCFHTPGGQVYELVGEEEEGTAGTQQHAQSAGREGHHRHNKQKKEKKKHKKRDHSSDSEDEVKRKHHKRKEKRRRHDSDEPKHKKSKKEKKKRKS